MYRKSCLMLAALAVLSAVGTKAWAHCQIPCGIYDDPARFAEMREHVTTIEKSINQIAELSKADELNHNQIVRWVMNKEDHANQLSEIVSYYFLAQRVKPADPEDRDAQRKYLRQLTLLHHMVLHAMKAKQTIDLENCDTLRKLIDAFETSYLGEKTAAEPHTHSHGHAAHSHGHATK